MAKAFRDLIGKRGESIVSARLMDFCGNRMPYFDPHPLGEKCPTFDYLVELVNAGPSTPYFLAQVKTTRKDRAKGGLQLPVGVKRGDVQRMVRCPFPTYLIGVEERTETAYIVSLHGSMRGPISSMPTKYPLDRANLKKLWDEVRAYWQVLDSGAKTSVFAF